MLAAHSIVYCVLSRLKHVGSPLNCLLCSRLQHVSREAEHEPTGRRAMDRRPHQTGKARRQDRLATGQRTTCVW